MTPFRQLSLLLVLLGLVIAVPNDAPTDAMSLASRAPLLGNQVAMVSLTPRAETATVDRPIASLFVGDAGRSFFAPYPARQRKAPQTGFATDVERGSYAGSDYLAILGGGGPADRVRHLIAAAEAGRQGYDAVQYGARIKPGKRPTDMTVAEVFAWIKATPGQPHAIGRYQFIPSTLRRLVDITGLDPRARFDPQVQDALADVLLAEAGFHEARNGRLSRRAFMNNLAKIWAGLPTSSGQSHYHGYAGNRATMTWARFDAEMATIFPG
ncbi:hypothetical protein ACOI1H_01655 [Loktanella sp. DJP18]|uniref:hypothetical protein n=1 Tax=Loktanella sp. DJP18 TaxID=3409788 RepID=UPI003BB4DC85